LVIGNWGLGFGFEPIHDRRVRRVTDLPASSRGMFRTVVEQLFFETEPLYFGKDTW
jgi:hypothetical protein